MKFKVGISRDVLNAKGEPSFGYAALEVLKGNPALEWEYLPERFAELTPDIASQYDGIYISSPKVTRASLARADRRVRILARHGVGYDSVDVPATVEFGVVLTNTPIAIRRPMAVAALTLIFALTSRLFVKDRLVREDRWPERTSHMGVGLTTRTLGLIGAGGIGQEVMGLARPFFRQMIAADPYGDAARVSALGASLAPIETVMKESDIVVCCCLLTDETRHLLDAAKFALMKPTAFFVNIARGPVVDEPALIAALQTGRIAGAGLDVFEREPTATDNPLKGMSNVILAPHALGWTDECFHDMAATGLQSIVDFSLGRRPVHVVNPEALARH
jgi:phosphoglycerate dehydrogenase-like enzyme